jgi:DNA-binding response OmpR family regulator
MSATPGATERADAAAGAIAWRPDPPPSAARLVLFVGEAIRPDGELSALMARAAVRAIWIGGVAQAWRASAEVVFDAIVIDAGLLEPPEEARLARLRSRLTCPMLVVARRADEIDEIVALEQGANGYVAQPISARRLRAQVLAVLRGAPRRERVSAPAPPTLDGWVAGWRLDLVTRRLCKGDQALQLTDTLGGLLHELVSGQGRVISRDRLLQRLRGLGSEVTLDGVDSYVHRLRRCLFAHCVSDFKIECVRGRGYAIHCEFQTHELSPAPSTPAPRGFWPHPIDRAPAASVESFG